MVMTASKPSNGQITWPLHTAPIVDGRVGPPEYERGEIQIAKSSRGEPVLVWLGLHGDFIYIAAVIPDTSYYWGDDFVVSFDPNGDGGTTLDSGDRQWYLRRDLDSSLVRTVMNSRWHEPPPLGKQRHGDGWDVASTSSPGQWTVELRIRAPRLGPMPRIAFRTYDDSPQGWWSWPAPPDSVRATVVERTPSLWMPLLGPGNARH
jgi:hypothetical protein